MTVYFVYFVQFVSTQFMSAVFREHQHLVLTLMSSSQGGVGKWQVMNHLVLINIVT